MSVPTQTDAPVLYPDSDGKPMSDNTLQWNWIVTIKDGLEILFADRDDVFIAGDLLWYPVEGQPTIRTAPDALVAFGRPKGFRGSYRQWEEGGIAPQVVFEILSRGNRPGEMRRKLAFYDRFGVEEYYVYDPYKIRLEAWTRQDGRLTPLSNTDGWVSPLLGIRFELTPDTLIIRQPDGQHFLTALERAARQRETELQAEEFQSLARDQTRRADKEARLREEASRRAEAAIEQFQAERLEKQRLLDRLRALGIDPDSV